MEQQTKIIWKFRLKLTVSQEVKMPKDAKILSVKNQRESIYIWAEVFPKNPLVPRYFRIVGTGLDSPPKNGVFLGTIMQVGGAFVWHIYETNEKE